MKYLLALLLACSIWAQPTATEGFVAGGPSDLYHNVTNICTFNGATATNPPCMAQYKDTTLPGLQELFYGYAGITFDYRIPHDNGTCDIVLQMYEPNRTAAGQRKFTVTAPGTPPVTIDIFAAIGVKKPLRVTIPGVSITQNFIILHFQPLISNAVVQTIEWGNCTKPLPFTWDGTTLTITSDVFIQGHFTLADTAINGATTIRPNLPLQ